MFSFINQYINVFWSEGLCRKNYEKQKQLDAVKNHHLIIEAVRNIFQLV